MENLKGKRAFVTGASRGIGAAIARRLAAQGANVALGYERSAQAADSIVQSIRQQGRLAAAIQMDASDASSIQHAVDQAASALGGLDILVNNAGIYRGGPVEQLTLQDVDTTLAVNVRGVILACQAVLTHLPNGGRIISIGSNLAIRVPDAGMGLYAASKAALIG